MSAATLPRHRCDGAGATIIGAVAIGGSGDRTGRGRHGANGVPCRRIAPVLQPAVIVREAVPPAPIVPTHGGLG